MNLKPAAVLAILSVSALQTFAAVIGTNVPATPLTADRVANLPAWKTYLENSTRQKQADQEFFRTDLKSDGLKQAVLPHKTNSAKGVALNNIDSWYRTSEARRIADIIVSFQTPAGGWSKNTDFTRSPRAPGELFGAENGSLFLSPNDFDTPEDATWDYVGTFDNDSTTTELRFLAKVISADKAKNSDLQDSFTRGLNYIFKAQYPNGGWPQVWPLQGGYHDAITFNDDAMLHIVEFLREVANGSGEFAFVPQEYRAQADTSWKQGLDCILAAQIKVDGHLTVWCQQHDAITLQPTSARNYEMPSETSSESGTITLFLMQLPNPDSKVVAAVNAAAAWFKKTAIEGKAFRVVGTESRKLVDAPGNGPIWARYYEVGTDKPIYGDRDKSIHDDVNEISRERRKGYAWFKDTPKRVLEHYTKWAKQHPAQP
ncbi:MAG TPA: pectate lyase [Verrucomicrobiae bacterium]|nr:pectate lyase [Verrucomicrobiae bacterium]